MKATLVLLPLLGITYMLFFVNPGEDEVSRVVFIYFNSLLESFQVWPPSLPWLDLAAPSSVGAGVTCLAGGSLSRELEAWGWGQTRIRGTLLTQASDCPSLL